MGWKCQTEEKPKERLDKRMKKPNWTRSGTRWIHLYKEFHLDKMRRNAWALYSIFTKLLESHRLSANICFDPPLGSKSRKQREHHYVHFHETWEFSFSCCLFLILAFLHLLTLSSFLADFCSDWQAQVWWWRRWWWQESKIWRLKQCFPCNCLVNCIQFWNKSIL